jgi:hypothetical protein
MPHNRLAMPRDVEAPPTLYLFVLVLAASLYGSPVVFTCDTGNGPLSSVVPAAMSRVL